MEKIGRVFSRFLFATEVLLTATALPACAFAAAAGPPLYSKQSCDTQAQSAEAFHECYAANLVAVNRALDEIYRALLAQKEFYVGSAHALRGVERAWVVYKERECAYEYGAGSGNEDYWLAHADCEIRVTEQRIRELEGRPSCTGGDSVCYPHMR